jgi:hypothetical protein
MVKDKGLILGKLHIFIMFSFLFLGVIMVSSSAQAQQKKEKRPPRFSAGPLIIHPLFSLNESYDENIFSTERNEVDDLLSRLTPGIKFILPYHNHRFMLDYNFTGLFYRKHSKLDTPIHRLNGSAELLFSPRFSVSLKEKFLSSVFTREAEEFGEKVEIDERFKRNDFSVLARIEHGRRLFTEVGYSSNILMYKNEQESFLDNYYKNGISLAFGYKTSPRTDIFGEYVFVYENYTDNDPGSRDDQKDNIQNTFFLGIKGDITPRTKGVIKFGLGSADFRGGEDWINFAIYVDIVHRLTRLTTLKLKLRRAAVETGFSTNNSFTATGGDLDLIRKLTRNLSVSIGGTYQINEYPEETTIRHGPGVLLDRQRKDELTRLRFRIAYKILDWFSAVLSYNLYARNSNLNFRSATYSRNVIGLKFTIAL